MNLPANDDSGPLHLAGLLDHLESLRWLLLKSAAAVLLGMLICLVAGNKFIGLLVWPLKHSRPNINTLHQTVILNLGPQMPRLVLDSEPLGFTSLGTNPVVSLQLGAIQSGTNLLLAFEPGPEIREEPLVPDVALKNFGPLGPFVVAIQLAIFGGVALASPLIFLFIGQFVLPFLRHQEILRRSLISWVTLGAILFLAGIAFCYLFLLKISLYGAVGFSQWMGFTSDEWSAENYIGFVCKFMLGMGVGFELPVVLLVAVRIGLLDYQRLKKLRTYWLVVNLGISAMVTPDGNPLTMCLMAAPLQVLYEISVWVAWYWERQERKREVNRPGPALTAGH